MADTGAVSWWFPGESELARLMAAYDWASSPLGRPDAWPQSLRTAVNIMLTSSQPIWIGWGPELTYLYNDPYKSIIGGKHPWALGRPTSHVWREIWNEIGPLLDQAMRGGGGTYVEAQLLIMERNGYPEETYYTFSYSPIPVEDGKPGGIFCANTDDTQRVLSERRLALLRELASAATNARNRQQAFEQSARALTTNQRDLPFALLYILEPDGRTATLVSHVGIAADHPACVATLSTEQPGPWPIVGMFGDGEPRVVRNLDQMFAGPMPTGAWEVPAKTAVVLPIPSPGGTGRSGFLIAGLNPFRLYEESYASFLGLVVGQIAASVASAEAYEQERRRAEALAEIDRAKTLFFSNISHEFRTPLTLMLSPLEEVLAKQQADMGDSRELVSVAHRNGVRLLKLVNALLDFSRIEAGRTRAHFEAVDISALTSELASAFRSAIDRANLTLTLDCPRLPHPATVDRDMWEKIIFNLLSNALKFTFEGGIAVRIAAAPDNEWAEVAVIDSGTGIPAAELPFLFERFHRVEAARGRSIEGSGIGLALVQELVKLLGGAITVQSEVGKGSTFTVRVPLATSFALPAREASSAPTMLHAEPYLQEARSWLGSAASMDGIPPASITEDPVLPRVPAMNELILLADDNMDMRDYVARLLRSAGYRVESVADGVQALSAARSLRPHLVLSDVMMPHLDGIRLIEALRADPATRDIPVILLSARAGEDAKIEGLQAGADDYLTKPFSARELVARVESNLKLVNIRREGERRLREEAQILEEINRVGTEVAGELDLEKAVQLVTDAATRLSAAEFGAFFYNVVDDKGESYMLYTISGVPREAFSKFPMPRNTAVFAPTFAGEATVRSADIRKDPRFGRNAPYCGHPKGHLPVVSYLATPVVSRTGEVLGGLFFGHPQANIFDARAQRLVEAISVQAANAIDKARLYRTAQADLQRAQEQLAQAQKMESIGQLTGGVAHDFNNLLTVIMGNLETAQRASTSNPNPSRLARALDHAMQGSRRAASVTQRLLAFSRRSPLDPKPLDTNKLIAGMSDLLRRTLGEQVKIEIVSSGGLWHVLADPNQLEVAILNLAVNARDAMPDGGKLTIETANAHLDEAYAASQSEVIPGQYAMVSISDTGLGMDRNTLARAFEPFFTTKDVGQGTGLGLSQVYGFAKQSGGHVRIYSEVGQGTSVKLYLPRLLYTEELESPLATQPAPRSGDGETILVVEDDADVRANTTGMLRELGYEVIEAEVGTVALRQLEAQSKIDLLFTDVGLPGGMNGRQLADAVQTIRPNLPVLFTTGYARNAIVHDGRLDPGVHLLPKPFTYMMLASKLAEILGSRSGHRRVLLVEDEILVRMVAEQQLSDLGFEVESAGSITEAMNKAKLLNGDFDLALIDLGLPDGKGDGLVAELRLLYPRLSVAIASGYSDEVVRERFRGDPNVRFIGKPYGQEDLRALMRRQHA